MKAIIQNSYGAPQVLELKEIEKPRIKDNDVLVRVRAAGLHAGDYFCLMGVPFLVRFVVGFPGPKNYIPGLDVAGEVEAVGRNVKRFAKGDKVFGSGKHACAEFAAIPQDTLVPMPENLSFEQAAAVPTSALAALHGLRDTGKMRSGQKILINGASGGVGTFAVQIAKSFGAEVTGVCSRNHVDMVNSIGADYVIDYENKDFTQSVQRYDLILDNVANRSFSEVRCVLAPQGKIIPNSGHAGLSYVIKASLRALVNQHQARPYVSTPNQKDLMLLRELLESGKITPVIDNVYPLDKTADALGYIGKGHAAGKVVIGIA
ncbi:zinc-binding dehydrogenase [candidate division KSB1 bacterium]|nr:zinc-binding dehydrogenase [candidate division KSB1 bacterium]